MQQAVEYAQIPGLKFAYATNGHGIDDCYDYRWCQVLDHLYDKFQRWKAGELTHWDMDEAIHKTHKQNRSPSRATPPHPRLSRSQAQLL